MRALMWFRSDLRVADNTALVEATQTAADGVIGVFCICPGQWRRHEWGFAKVDFIRRNLVELSRELSGHNIPLKLIQVGDFEGIPSKLLAAAHEHRCETLFFNQEYEFYERRRDEAVERLFRGRGLEVRSYHDQTILPPEQPRTGQGGAYAVFTPYKKKWIQSCQELRISPRTRIPRQRPLGIPSDDIPAVIEGFDKRAPGAIHPGGERSARKRLREFITRRLADYRRRRDLPGDQSTSELSPYIAAGVLSPRQCLRAALDSNDGRLDSGDEGAVTWISELIWREFYRHVLATCPRVCMNYAFKPETDRLAWSRDERSFEAWQAGLTGVPIVDAGMRQLLETGWMHNRVRMITAMYLTKDLFIDWRWGERHFMQHLADGDFANNNGGWQWSASTGVDAAPYFRVFNPSSQSKRYDPTGKYIRRYVPELSRLEARLIHDPPPDCRRKVDYPPPLVDHAAARRLVLREFRAISRKSD